MFVTLVEQRAQTGCRRKRSADGVCTLTKLLISIVRILLLKNQLLNTAGFFLIVSLKRWFVFNASQRWIPFAPSLRLLQWMGSCFQGPASCNEQDGVQSLFHYCLFSQRHSRPASDVFWIGTLAITLKKITLLQMQSRTVFQNGSVSGQNTVPPSDSGQHGGERVLTGDPNTSSILASCIEIVVSGKIFGHRHAHLKQIRLFCSPVLLRFSKKLRINWNQTLFFPNFAIYFCKYYWIF